ncbi:MAG: oxygenase MpaB family protein [Candidatus Dormibacteria bacterium]
MTRTASAEVDLDPSAARPRPLPIRDRSPDPGLFGPGSVTWRVMSQPLLMLGAGRALLLQAAHPLVAEGAIEHSAYATDPFGRFERTVAWVTIVCFGTTAEARAATREVNRLHRGVHGRLSRPHATEAVPSGSPYSGRDPELLRWVLATFVDTMLVAHDIFVGGLTVAERDGFVVEWRAVGDLMAVPAGGGWDSRSDLSAYVAGVVASGRGRPGAGSRLVSTTVLRPPLTSLTQRPLWDTLAFATVGLLPAEIRHAYGVRWSPLHSAAHATLAAGLRSGRVILPRRVRVSPVAEFATARAEGRLRAAPGRPRGAG